VLRVCNMAEFCHFWRMQIRIRFLDPLPNRSVANWVASWNVASPGTCGLGIWALRLVTLSVFALLSREDTRKVSSDRGWFLLNPYPTKNHPHILRYLNRLSQNASCSDERHHMCSCRTTEFRNNRLTVQLSHVQSFRVFILHVYLGCVRRRGLHVAGSWHGLTVGFLKTKRILLYIWNQSVPPCKHFPPRL
jgi:hypothetical protein